MTTTFSFARFPSMPANSVVPPVPPTQVMGPTALCQGFSTFSGKGLNTVVESLKQSTTDPTNNFYYQICTDFASISKFFQVDESISTDEFLLTKADATSKFLSSLNITTYSVVIGFSCFATSTLAMSMFNLPANLIPTDATGMQAFLLQNGDQFVKSITKGAGYIGCYVFYSESVTEQTQVSTTLTGKDISEEGTVSATVTAAWSQALQSISTRSSFIGQSFGVSGGTPPATLTDVVPYLQLISDSAALRTATVLSFVSLNYEDAGMDAAIRNLAPDLISNRSDYPTLAGYADQLAALSMQMTAVQTAQYAYNYKDDQLNQRMNQVVNDQSNVLNLINELATKPWQTATSSITQPVSLSWGMPVLAFTTIQGPSWGNHDGTGGDRITYFDRGIVYGGHALQSITINGGEEVDYLLLGYDGLEPLHLGAPDSGSTASPQTLTLAPGETVQSVACEAEDYIHSLTIKTSAQSLSWPLHPHGAPTFGPWPDSIPQNAVFAGFGGAYDSKDKYNLWTITPTPVLVQMSPATWMTLPPSGAG